MTDPAPQESSKPRKRATKPKRVRTSRDRAIKRDKTGALWLRLPESAAKDLGATVDWLAGLSIGSDFAESLLLEGVADACAALQHKATGKLQRALTNPLTTSPPDRGERGASGADGG